ncbi:MAG: hypothetical protein ACT4PT_05780 [Methanobacteriota archaeon]
MYRRHRIPLVGALAVLSLVLLVALAHRGQAIGESIEVSSTDVLEGSAVLVTVRGIPGDTQRTVTVSCDPCGTTYTAAVSMRTTGVSGPPVGQIVFPHGFPDAFAAGEPRWNASYRVRVLEANAPIPAAETRFTAWGVDVYKYPGAVAEPADPITVRYSGFTPGSTVTVRARQQPLPNGDSYFFNVSLVADARGMVWTNTMIPKALGGRPRCVAPCENFLVFEALGPGKALDRTIFAWRPATLRVTYVEGPVAPGGGSSFQRTETAAVSAILQYRSQVAVSEDFLPGTSFVVESVRGAIPTHEATVPAVPRGEGFRGEWEVPVDQAITIGGAPTYRFRILEAADRYGNPIDPNASAPFEVSLATLRVALKKTPASLERTENGTAEFEITYPNGSGFLPGMNATQVAGAFQRIRSEPTTGTEIDETVRNLVARHTGEGVWAVWTSVERNFTPLGPHRFRVLETQDRFGNPIPTLGTPPFELGIARPRLDFLTLVEHEERPQNESLVQGETVEFQLAITYPDGTPYNRTATPPNLQKLRLDAHKFSSTGALLFQTKIDLSLAQASKGIWKGTYQFPRGNTTLVGTWDFNVSVEDNTLIANRNASAWTRTVSSTRLSVEPLAQPNSTVRPGDPAVFRFRLHYPDGPIANQTDFPEGPLVTVHLRRGSTANQSATLVTTAFAAMVEPGVWETRFVPSDRNSVGYYHFQVSGLSPKGGAVIPTSSSIFFLELPGVARPLVQSPPAEVPRGRTITVVYDGVVGDLGPGGVGTPVIEVRRWDSRANLWRVEIPNARRDESAGGDHLGVFEPDLATTLGMYRFVLLGESAQGAVLRSESDAFRLVPATVARAVYTPFPAVIPRLRDSEAVLAVAATDRFLEARAVDPSGGSADLDIEVSPGDAILAGISASTGNGTIGASGALTASWRVVVRPPLKTSPGPYTLVVFGEDVFGNQVRIEAPRFRLEPLAFEVRPLSFNPAATRGAEYRFRFSVHFPDGEILGSDVGLVTASVTGIGGTNLTARTVYEANERVWTATWAPENDRTLGTYRFRIEGRDRSGNSFSSESPPIDLGAGTLGRPFLVSPTTVRRAASANFELVADPEDSGVEFHLVRGNTRLQAFGWAVKEGASRYTVRWTPKLEDAIGTYQIEFTAIDGTGNRLRSLSNPIELQPAQLGTVLINRPGPIIPGETAEWTFRVMYPDQTTLTPERGVPLVSVAQSGTRAHPEPALAWEDDHWVAIWTSQPETGRGLYRLIAGGTDREGNEIQTYISPELVLWRGELEEVYGIPAFPPLFALFALAAVALLIRRK